MPIYLYTDENDHTQTVTHRMLYSTGVICIACGLQMWRKPQGFQVTWGGLRPSAGELDPEVKQLVNTADERRDKFIKRHEKHERDSLHR